jgi:hypothetical protein
MQPYLQQLPTPKSSLGPFVLLPALQPLLLTFGESFLKLRQAQPWTAMERGRFFALKNQFTVRIILKFKIHKKTKEREVFTQRLLQV